ncbi:uncharacterized protein [Typha angustifolia]|uniref:uncharacterized protein n=1 Tax=Typha angustifolia TaxID=59011 RepID=UPI003C305B11
MERYRLRAGQFSTAKVAAAISHNTPAEWWSIYGWEEASNLTPIAKKILSQTVSSSQCERNWTTFSLIHTKTRNRLTMEILEKLVFCHYNMRLRERNLRRKAENEQLIDLNHVFDEEDPLTPWIREIEDRVLDDRDNPWLDEILGETTTRAEAGTSYSTARDSIPISTCHSPNDTYGSEIIPSTFVEESQGGIRSEDRETKNIYTYQRHHEMHFGSYDYGTSSIYYLEPSQDPYTSYYPQYPQYSQAQDPNVDYYPPQTQVTQQDPYKEDKRKKEVQRVGEMEERERTSCVAESLSPSLYQGWLCR